MKLISLELANFRKFRKPITISGFSDGLNIVVEPNETGKSTLLESLRAALFIRHAANTDLTRSYCPIGDNVAPKVAVDFEIDGAIWRIEKQFLKSPSALLSGPGGRFENDAAEEHLQGLLGFDRGNNKGTDPDTRGALGLLWVEQASAFAVDKPGKRVRDTVRSALESEIGAITGGRRFEVVHSRIDDAFAELRTPKSGKATGKLATAEDRLARASNQREEAESLVRLYETTLTDVEHARQRKRLVERDLADTDQGQRRVQLDSDLKLAESATAQLAAAEARHTETASEVERLEERLAQITTVETAIAAAEIARDEAVQGLAEYQTERDAAIIQEDAFRIALANARTARNDADLALTTARAAAALHEQRDATTRATLRFRELEELETERSRQAKIAATAIGADELARLKDLDRKVIEARAVVAAGAVKLDISINGDTILQIDGEVAAPGPRDVSKATVIAIGDHARIAITPPGAGATSAAVSVQAAEAALGSALARCGAETYSTALAQNDAARAAADRVASIERQINTLCIADRVLNLAAGPDALKALLATTPSINDPAVIKTVDLVELILLQTKSIDAENSAIGRHEAASAELRKIEAKFADLQRKEAGAQRDLDNAQRQLEALVLAKGKVQLLQECQQANEERQRRALVLTKAQKDAAVFNTDTLRLGIANIDQSIERGREERTQLIGKIAGFEATLAVDGPKGLAGQLASAREEEAAAAEACERLQMEADVLALLRMALTEAADNAARTFLGPVTRRAARYVRRILPDCDVDFDQDFGLSSITRGGISEGCDMLSRGTQEQLAILTRLAFADMLLEQKAPVSLILDDPLVYSDDVRLDTMTDILTGASERMQVILLTCRERAFRHLAAAKRIELSTS